METMMSEPLSIARSKEDICLLPQMANRHGLITGATGTGKTVTLQRIAERLSAIGVPVFMADVKGDLAGLSQAGELSPKLKARLESLKLDAPKFAGCPVTFWDVFGQQGSPVRANRRRDGAAAAVARARAQRRARRRADAGVQGLR
jgi:hypothetical protein